MNFIDFVVASTHDKFDTIVVSELIGKPLPYAFFINHGAHGYAKFKID